MEKMYVATAPDEFVVTCVNCGHLIQPYFCHMFGGEWVHTDTGNESCEKFYGNATLVEEIMTFTIRYNNERDFYQHEVEYKYLETHIRLLAMQGYTISSITVKDL